MTTTKLVDGRNALRVKFVVEIDLDNETAAKEVAKVCRTTCRNNMNCNWLDEIADIIDGR